MFEYMAKAVVNSFLLLGVISVVGLVIANVIAYISPFIFNIISAFQFLLNIFGGAHNSVIVAFVGALGLYFVAKMVSFIRSILAF